MFEEIRLIELLSVEKASEGYHGELPEKFRSCYLCSAPATKVVVAQVPDPPRVVPSEACRDYVAWLKKTYGSDVEFSSCEEHWKGGPRRDVQKRPLERAVSSMVRSATGRDYRVSYSLLDSASLREMVRLLRDLDEEKTMYARSMQKQPWRRA